MHRLLTLLLLALPPLATASQVAVGGRVLSLAMLALGPLVASMVTDWRRTVAWSVYAMAFAVPMTLVDDTFPPAREVARLVSLLPVFVFAVVNSAVREQRETRLRDVLAVSRVAQSTILRELPPMVAGVPVVARYRSAAAESQVGGDLYEAVPWSAGVRLLVADVRGKGLDAVRTAARTVAAFRDAAEDVDASLVDVVAAVDRSVRRGLGDEEFVTAVFAELTRDGVLRMVSCGHPAPLLVRRDSAVAELAPAQPTLPLGLLRGLGPGLGLRPEPAIEEHRVERGDRLLFFSDGLMEARDDSGAFFPLSEEASALSQGTLTGAVDRLLAALDQFARSLPDDLVLLALERPMEVAPQHAAHRVLPRDGSAPALARDVVGKALADVRLGELVDDALLLTNELVTNALLHTSGDASLDVLVGSESVRVEVRDRSALPPLAGLLDAVACSGRGLLLVQRLAADWGAEPVPATGGKVVWFVLRGGQGPAAVPSDEELLALWDLPMVAAPGADPLRGSVGGPLGREQVRHVLLTDLDAALFVASRAHVEDLLREMVLVVQGAEASPVGDRGGLAVDHQDDELVQLARRITALAARLEGFRAGMRSQAVAAEASGAATCALEMTLPVSSRPALVDYRKALDEADRLCEQGRLLLPPAPREAQFRRWKLGRIVDQLGAGKHAPGQGTADA